jgi:hypothetical protein
MDRKSSAFAIRHLVIALVAATFALPVQPRAVDLAMPEQMRGAQTPSAPVILAQGRCFNGKCF